MSYEQLHLHGICAGIQGERALVCRDGVGKCHDKSL